MIACIPVIFFVSDLIEVEARVLVDEWYCYERHLKLYYTRLFLNAWVEV